MKKRIGFFGHIWHFVLMLVVITLLGFIVMLLWNWLIPSIFGVTSINFWQSLGLFALIRILLGHIGFKHGKRSFAMKRNYNIFHDKWINMSPEEQKDFIKYHNYHRFHDFHSCFKDAFTRRNTNENNDISGS